MSNQSSLRIRSSGRSAALKVSMFGACALTLCAAAAFLPHAAMAQTQPAAGASAPALPAGDRFVISGLNDQGEVRLLVNKSTIITTSRPQKRVSVAEPSIVDVNGISPTRILMTAKKTGSTQLIIWDEQDRPQTIDVIVQQDVTSLREQLGKISGATIDVSTAEDTVILRGRVPSLEVGQQAEALAGAYGKKVANLLEVAGGQQVMLQVRVAEVSKSAVQQLGVNFGFTDGIGAGASNIGQIAPFGFKEIGNAGGQALAAQTALSSSVSLFGRGQIGNTAFNVFLSAMRDNNLLRVLAEPNLVAMSGQEASFLAGGEFPIPVPQTGSGNTSTITIEYREFGIKLNFVPIVLGDGRIRLKVSPEVSDLDFTTAVQFNGFVVPGLSQRKATTTVELPDGQTLAIAGLLSQSVTAQKSVVPLLGDIPVLGSVFRSVRYQRKETELVIFVTPVLVGPMNPADAPAMPGEVWRHPNEADLFLNQDIGGAVTGARRASSDGAGQRTMGQYGFTSSSSQAAAAPASGTAK